jgi:hypothetical protein
MNRKSVIISLIIAFSTIVMLTYFYGRSVWVPVYKKVFGMQTISEILTMYGGPARLRLEPFFKKAGVLYPPEKITFLAIKDTKQLELWAETPQGSLFIRSYPIQALSGISGPKLREGDRQVPEGIYKVEGLNPNSAFHLSLKLNYPNAFDIKHAAVEGRKNPGSNIFIHGKALSIGCLAMGDIVIEELFILASDVGKSNVMVAIAPSDPRIDPLPLENISPQWLSDLYKRLNEYFAGYEQHKS